MNQNKEVKDLEILLDLLNNKLNEALTVPKGDGTKTLLGFIIFNKIDVRIEEILKRTKNQEAKKKADIFQERLTKLFKAYFGDVENIKAEDVNALVEIVNNYREAVLGKQENSSEGETVTKEPKEENKTSVKSKRGRKPKQETKQQ